MIIQTTAQVRSANTVSVSRQANRGACEAHSSEYNSADITTQHKSPREPHSSHCTLEMRHTVTGAWEQVMGYCSARAGSSACARRTKGRKRRKKGHNYDIFMLAHLEIICNFAVKPSAPCVNKRGLAQKRAERAAIQPRTTCGVVSVVGNSLDCAQNSQFLIV